MLRWPPRQEALPLFSKAAVLVQALQQRLGAQGGVRKTPPTLLKMPLTQCSCRDTGRASCEVPSAHPKP